MVAIPDEDYDVARVLIASRNHWVTNGEKIIDIDIRAVESAMNIYNVKDKETCFERVRNVFHRLLEESKEDLSMFKKGK